MNIAPTVQGGYPLVGHTTQFHKETEQFLAQNRTELDSTVFSASILFKTVTFVTSHSQVDHVLKAEEFSAAQAHIEFGEKIYPDPNVLYHDPDSEKFQQLRIALEQMFGSTEAVDYGFTSATSISTWTLKTLASKEELYAYSKKLAERIVVKVMLGMDPDDTYFDRVIALQRVVFKGQLSLPVAVNLMFVESGLSKGIKSRIELEDLVKDRLEKALLPIYIMNNLDKMDKNILVPHLILFSGSLVVKALSSLISNLTLQLMRHPDLKLTLQSDFENLASRFIMETERMFPPIMGCPRKSTRSTKVQEFEIQENADVWAYFGFANRDPSIFKNPETFSIERDNHDCAFSFGGGSKICIGKSLIRSICKAYLKVLLSVDLKPLNPLKDKFSRKLLPVNRIREEIFFTCMQ
jgi:cytochrome P450